MARVECLPRLSALRRLDEVRGFCTPSHRCRHRSTKHREKVAGSMIMSFGNPNAVNCFYEGWVQGQGWQQIRRISGEKPSTPINRWEELLVAIDCLSGPL